MYCAGCDSDADYMAYELKRLTRAIEKLDEAMATPERVAEDTALVGGFVSGIDLTYTAEDVVNRAIEYIRAGRSLHGRQ